MQTNLLFEDLESFSEFLSSNFQWAVWGYLLGHWLSLAALALTPSKVPMGTGKGQVPMGTDTEQG